MLLFALLSPTQNAHVIQGYIGCYHHHSGTYYMLKEEAVKLQVIFRTQGDMYYKVRNVGNGIYPTRYPDDLA